MEADSHVTLHCLLHTHDNCEGSEADEGVSLSWVDETGKELQNNTIPPPSTHTLILSVIPLSLSHTVLWMNPTMTPDETKPD